MTGPLWNALPNGWLTGQVKNAATVTLGKMLQSKDSGDDVRAPYLRAANVQPDGVLALDDVNEMWFGVSELEQLSIQAGDIVVVEGGQGGFGRAAYVAEDLPGWGFQNSINRLRPTKDFDSRFITFYLIALRASGFIHAYSNVVSMPHLTAEKLARIPMPLPPLDEQRAIANYLERETTRIDTLIEEQQRLIELLLERRAAATVDAFATMGGDGKTTREGHVPIPWLPELQIDRVMMRHLCTIGTGSSDSANAVADGYPFFVRGDQPLALDHYEFDTEAIITAGDGAMVGRSFHHYRGKFAAHQRVYVLRDFKGIFPRYLYWYFSTYFIRVVGDGGAQATVPSVRRPMIAGMPVPVPPLDEQIRVAAYLDEQTTKIDRLIAEAERFIALSKERRSALITAAVTGQIDVRGRT